MNKPEAYNKAEILNSSVMTDEISPIMIGVLQEAENQTDDNSAIEIAELQNNDNQTGSTRHAINLEMAMRHYV